MPGILEPKMGLCVDPIFSQDVHPVITVEDNDHSEMEYPDLSYDPAAINNCIGLIRVDLSQSTDKKIGKSTTQTAEMPKTS